MQVVESNTNNNNAGVFLNDSSGKIHFLSTNYIPNSDMPSIAYIFVGRVSETTYRGRITFNGRNGGISNNTFATTKFVYEDSDGVYYEADLNGISGLNNFISLTPLSSNFTSDLFDLPTPTSQNTQLTTNCCDGLTQLTESNTDGHHGIFFDQSEGTICFDSKNYEPSSSVPIIVYVFKGNVQNLKTIVVA